MQPESRLGASTEALDPILATVRQCGFRAVRLVGTAMAAFSSVALAWRYLHGRPMGGGGMLLAVALLLGLSVLSWRVPARSQWASCAVLLAALTLLLVVGLWRIGPTLSMGSLTVMAPVLATFYFGPRATVPSFAAAALALLGVGAVSAALGRPEVGGIQGAAVPYGVYARLAVTSLGALAVALAAQHAALRAMEFAVRRAREASDRERAENEQRVLAEQALSQAKRLETISQLAGGVVHDTRNSLVVLAAGIRELRRAPRPPGDAAVLEDMDHAAAGMSRTLEQLLSLGRREEDAAEPVRLDAALASFAHALRRVVPADVEVRLEAAGCEAAALLDAGRLERALLNLALNARDAMPAGGMLTLRAREEPRQGRTWALLEIEDTGTGMDAATTARLFEPFFTTKATGTGLGLATVRRFAEEAGGAVEVESAAGRGTRVRLAFPAVPQVVDAADPATAPPCGAGG